MDSDVVIDILRGKEGPVSEERALCLSGVPVYCTAVTWAEVFAGLRRGEEEAARAFLEARGEVVLDAVAGRRAGIYLARYARSHGVAIADALIAAAATTVGLALWTENRRHYPMPDLAFHEPAKSRG